MRHRPVRLTALLLPALLWACGEGLAVTAEDGEAARDAELTSLEGTERSVRFSSYVYVEAGTPDDRIGDAIARQVKTALGALRTQAVGLRDRGATSARATAAWVREPVELREPGTAPPRRLQRVRFTYADRAIVGRAHQGRSTLPVTLLFGDFVARAAEVRASCSDDPASADDSLWYHYAPWLRACQALQATEAGQLAEERRRLGSASPAVGPREVGRLFMPVVLELGPPVAGAPAASPEYDRLFGLDDGRTEVQVYAFFGVDADVNDPDDALGREAFSFFRALLRGVPNLRVVETRPFSMLLDLEVDGVRVEGVTFERLVGWALGEGGYPARVGTDPARVKAFRRQCAAKLTERAIDLAVPLTVGRAGRTEQRTLRVRFFYGLEDGSPQARQAAQWRYLEAFWHGDVFLYNGHSHFGHGPLEPNLYAPWNFNERYQLMLVNSCLSYNYYHDDFFQLKPGGTRNLDKVVNGLPSSVRGSGAVTAALLSGLFAGRLPGYGALLGAMQAAAPAQLPALRLVDGELDNRFSQAATPLTLTVGPPLY